LRAGLRSEKEIAQAEDQKLKIKEKEMNKIDNF